MVAPSRGIKIIGADSRETARKRFGEMGLKVTFGKHMTDDNWDMMGTSSIADRVEDIHEAFANPEVKAIFTIIGGFNSNQLLPFLDYELIRKNPKIFCGFSDITALLNGIYAQTGLVTFSGPHYSSFGMARGFDYTQEHVRNMLCGKGGYVVEPSKEWSDDLWFIGGNLGTFDLLLGSPYRPAFKKNTILFVENCFGSAGDDTTFLRELQALAYQPDFINVKAVVIGRFQKASEISREKLEYIVNSIPQLKELPVIANVDFGHTTPMLTLPIGGRCEITSDRIQVQI